MKFQSEKIRPLMAVLAVGLGLALALVIGLFLAPVDPAQAQIVLYVDDDTCPATGSGSQGDPFCRIQDAVDAAGEDYQVRVAGGTYTGVQEVTIEQWEGPYTYTQVVVITKSLTLQGGYSPADWYTPDPVANETIIDAERQGRGISIVGTYIVQPQVTVDGFTITGGDYTDLGNPDGVANQVCAHPGTDCGGGLYAYKSGLTLRNSVIIDNIASRNGGRGGGIYVTESVGPTRIENTDVISNSAAGSSSAGGGLYAIRTAQPITITRSTFQDNAAPRGGGLVLDFNIQALVTISEVDMMGNHASQEAGGGAYIRLAEDGELLRVDRVRFQDNQAYDRAGAFYLDGVGGYTTRARLTNLLFAGNRLTVAGDRDAIVCIRGVNSNLDVELAHVTAADNSAVTFLYAEPGATNPYTVNVTLTNTLLSFFTNAFAAEEFGGGEVTIHHSHTLHQHVENLHKTVGGSPTFTAVNPLADVPPELSPSYHLTSGSAAIDAGVDAGVDHDIDGDPRPFGDGFDIGADEFVLYSIYLPLTLRNE